MKKQLILFFCICFWANSFAQTQDECGSYGDTAAQEKPNPISSTITINNNLVHKLVANTKYKTELEGALTFEAKESIKFTTGFKAISEDNSSIKTKIIPEDNLSDQKIILWGAMDADVLNYYLDDFYNNVGFDGIVYSYFLRDWYDDSYREREEDNHIFKETYGKITENNTKFPESFIKTGINRSIINWLGDNNSIVWQNVFTRFNDLTTDICQSNSRGLIIDVENYSRYNTTTGDSFRITNLGITNPNTVPQGAAVMTDILSYDTYKDSIFYKAKIIGESIATAVYGNNREADFILAIAQEGILSHYGKKDSYYSYSFWPYFFTGILKGLEEVGKDKETKIRVKLFWQGAYFSHLCDDQDGDLTIKIKDIHSEFNNRIDSFLENYDLEDYYENNFSISLGSSPIVYQGSKNSPSLKHNTILSPSEFKQQLQLFNQVSNQVSTTEDAKYNYSWVYAYGNSWWRISSDEHKRDFWDFNSNKIGSDNPPTIWILNDYPDDYRDKGFPVYNINDYYNVVKLLSPNSTNLNSLERVIASKALPQKNRVLKIIPNAVKDFGDFYFETSNSGKASIYITDIHGKLITNIVSNKPIDKGMNKQPFSVKNLNAGLYFVILTINNQKFVSKLIKLK